MSKSIAFAARELWYACMDATPEEFDAAAQTLALYMVDVVAVRHERALIDAARARRRAAQQAPDLSRVTEWPSTRDDADRNAS